MKRELTVLVLDVDPIQSDGVEVGIESQIRAHALHGGNSATLASAETTCRQVTPVPAQHRVHERVAHCCAPLKEARDAALARFEELYVAAALHQANGNVTRAAERAGVSRRFLPRLIARLRIRNAD